jgi:hypothetical protein
VAVKKKSAAKKAAPKKSAAKKSAAKKSAAKKTVKKSAVKKTAAKKTVKKSAVKKTAAKKKVTKKTTVRKKAVKKSAARKSSASQVVIPPVPSIGSSSRVNVSTTPAAATPRPAAKGSSTSKPAAKSQGSTKVLFAVLVGILLIGAFVISGSDKDGDDAPAPVPAVTETPEASAAPEETMEATEPAEPAEPAATTGEAPSRFIGNWKDSSKSVMVITWKAPMGDVTGYKVETRSNLGEWKVVSEVSATTYSAEFAKGATDGSTSFRVSAVYADGTLGVATPFGFAGQFE